MTAEEIVDREFPNRDGMVTVDSKAAREAIAILVNRAVVMEREACAQLAEHEYVENAGAQRGLPEIHKMIRGRQ